MAFESAVAAAIVNPSIRPRSNGSTPARLAHIPHDLTPARLSVAQYHAMARKGILKSGDPIELLEGWLVYKMTKKPPHTIATLATQDALRRILPVGWYIASQEPITLSDSEPEPDIVLVRGDYRQYIQRHPGPKEVALIVEVADSTLQRDRGTKKRIYARAGIPVYWVINLLENQIEVYTHPKRSREPDYQTQQIYTAVDEIPVVMDGRKIAMLAVQDLLP